MTIERNVKGLLGTKLGMTQLWDENNRIVPVTVIAAGTNVVTQVRTPETDGYNAIQVGFGEIDGRKVTKPRAGHFEQGRHHAAPPPGRDPHHRPPATYTVGQELPVDTFAAGDEIDVTGTSKGKGFAGTMKRHGFHGVSSSHGAHRNHRKPGSIGACATPGRVFKGMRMAGRMGSDTVTTQNLTVHAVDADKGLILDQGRRPRPQGWPRRAPLGGQEAPDDRRGGLSMATKSSTDASVDLPAEIFDVEVNIPLIHQVVVAQQAAARQGTHATKTRGEVRGGGRKPYKQKGTGRARQGSTRAPQFVGGGVVHGPQPRSYDQRTPKKMKAAALRGALSDRARDGRIHVVDGFGLGEAPSTKTALASLIALSDRHRFLVVLERTDAVTWLSLRNAPEVHIVAVDQLNTYDVVASDDVVFTQGAFDAFVNGTAATSERKATVVEAPADDAVVEAEDRPPRRPPRRPAAQEGRRGAGRATDDFPAPSRRTRTARVPRATRSRATPSR